MSRPNWKVGYEFLKGPAHEILIFIALASSNCSDKHAIVYIGNNSNSTNPAS